MLYNYARSALSINLYTCAHDVRYMHAINCREKEEQTCAWRNQEQGGNVIHCKIAIIKK
jgi:hypothetical protein